MIPACDYDHWHAQASTDLSGDNWFPLREEPITTSEADAREFALTMQRHNPTWLRVRIVRKSARISVCWETHPRDP